MNSNSGASTMFVKIEITIFANDSNKICANQASAVRRCDTNGVF